MRFRGRMNLKSTRSIFLGCWLALVLNVYLFPTPRLASGEILQSSSRLPIRQVWINERSDELQTLSQQDEGPVKLVVGGTFILEKDQVLYGGLIVLGGSVTLEEGSLIEGDNLLLGGELSVDGRIVGDILVLGGKILLHENAEVDGNLTMLGGSLVRETGSKVESVEYHQLPLFKIPANPIELVKSAVEFGSNPLWNLFSLLFRSFVWAAVAVLVILFFPNQALQTSKVLSKSTIASGGTGCLILLVAPVFLIILPLTIIGIPFSVVFALTLLIMWCFGLIAAGLEVGSRLTQALRQDWALPVSAGMGIFLLTLVMNVVVEIIPCIGWILPGIIGAVGLGGVLLTRFGSRSYPPIESELKTPVISIEDPPGAE